MPQDDYIPPPPPSRYGEGSSYIDPVILMRNRQQQTSQNENASASQPSPDELNPKPEEEKEKTKETIHYNFNYEANLTEEDLVSLQSAIESSLEAGKRCR